MTHQGVGPPSPQEPLLVGLLVDVSGTMATAVRTSDGPGSSRMNSLWSAFDDLIDRAARWSTEGVGGKISPRLKLFAYGFGFGGALAYLLDGGGPKVRDLLDLGDGTSPTVPIDRLANDHQKYRDHISELMPSMFADTPMVEGLLEADRRFQRERATAKHTPPPILLLVSDGEPTDGGADDVRRIAEQMRESGVVIVSCLLTDSDLTEPRRLYGKSGRGWPKTATLMFDCASKLTPSSPLRTYFIENRWSVDLEARLFTQINHSEVLSEFAAAVLSPLVPDAAVPATQAGPIRVFITYSHQDASYLEPNSLLGFLAGLRAEGFEFFTDTTIKTGDIWEDELKKEIQRTDVVLALVSQSFLNSDYCKSEVERFLEARQRLGTQILPVILSPCSWESHPWLAKTQARPRDSKSIEVDFVEPGRRKQVFLDILHDLRAAGEVVQRRRAGSYAP